MADHRKSFATRGGDERCSLVRGDGTVNLLRAEGPVVKCVILRAPRRDVGNCATTPASRSTRNDTLKNDEKCNGLEDLVEELEIGAAPQKSEVEQLLGGPITFIGRYGEAEAIILVGVRGLVKGVEEDDEGCTTFGEMTIGQLQAQCIQWGVSADDRAEKHALVDALKEKEQTLPLPNPHKLQPPLHNVRVRGDILVLRVAEGRGNSLEHNQEEEDGRSYEKKVGKEEELDTEKSRSEHNFKKGQGGEDTLVAANSASAVRGLESSGCFLSYTREAYLKFAAQTDIADSPVPSNGTANNDKTNDELEDENEKEFGHNETDGNGVDCSPGEEEMTEKEEKSAMLNIVMSELLRKFRSDNRRGADSQEVLEIRASVAEQLGMEVVTYDESQEAAQHDDKKKAAENMENKSRTGHPHKRVKFNSNLDSGEPKRHKEEDGSGLPMREDPSKPQSGHLSAAKPKD